MDFFYRSYHEDKNNNVDAKATPLSRYKHGQRGAKM